MYKMECKACLAIPVMIFSKLVVKRSKFAALFLRVEPKEQSKLCTPCLFGAVRNIIYSIQERVI